ncbi:MAG TPA: hypothetical protein VGI70_19365 [Polyangiales bacterium]|jgi:hypothetical protein
MKILSGLVFLFVLAVGVAQVHANGDPLLTQAEFAARAKKAEALAERVHRVQTYNDKYGKMQMAKGNWERVAPTAYVPELDPNAAGAAIALLVGGALVMVERRKRIAV